MNHPSEIGRCSTESTRNVVGACVDAIYEQIEFDFMRGGCAANPLPEAAPKNNADRSGGDPLEDDH